MKNLFCTTNLLWLIAALFLSCGKENTIKLRQKIGNLENFDLGIDIEKFYTREETPQSKSQTGILPDSTHTTKDTENPDNILAKIKEFQWIKVDTVYSGGNYLSPENPMGIQYNMRSWSEADSVAYYGSIYFGKIDMMKSLNGDFMALVVSHQRKGDEGALEFKELLSYVEKENGKATVIEKDFFGLYYIYFWELEDRLLAICAQSDDREYPLKLGGELGGQHIRIDPNNPPKISTKLFILNNKFKKRSIIAQMNSGDWLFFNELLKDRP